MCPTLPNACNWAMNLLSFTQIIRIHVQPYALTHCFTEPTAARVNRIHPNLCEQFVLQGINFLSSIPSLPLWHRLPPLLNQSYKTCRKIEFFPELGRLSLEMYKIKFSSKKIHLQWRNRRGGRKGQWEEKTRTWLDMYVFIEEQHWHLQNIHNP